VIEIEAADKAMRARVSGKQDTARRTVWQLNIGDLRLRCLSVSCGHVVQIRSAKGWESVDAGRSANPLSLLRAVLQLRAVASELDKPKGGG